MVEQGYRSALAGLINVSTAESTESPNKLRQSDRQGVLALRGRDLVVEAALSATNLGTPAMLGGTRNQAGRVLRLGPDEWMILVPYANFRSVEAALQERVSGQHTSLVDISERTASVDLTGPQSPLILAAACPLDLHASVSPAGFASRTLFGKAEIVLERGIGFETFAVHTNRSFAPYVWQLLLEVGREHQLTPS